MEEERVMDKPEKADGGEGAKVGEVLGAVNPQSRRQAAAKLLLHDCGIWDVVLARRKEPEKLNIRRFFQL